MPGGFYDSRKSTAPAGVDIVASSADVETFGSDVRLSFHVLRAKKPVQRCPGRLPLGLRRMSRGFLGTTIIAAAGAGRLPACRCLTEPYCASDSVPHTFTVPGIRQFFLLVYHFLVRSMHSVLAGERVWRCGGQTGILLFASDSHPVIVPHQPS